MAMKFRFDARWHLGLPTVYEARRLVAVLDSQGPCVDCQGMLSRLKIAHNTHRYSKESPSPNWVDPFTWQDIHSQSLPDERLSATSMGQRFGEREAESIMAKRRAKKSVKGGEEGDE